MTAEVFLLALLSTVRPTSMAATYALVSSPEPRRLMIAYVLAGLSFTVAFGLLVIWAFSGLDLNAGTSRTKSYAELAGGILLFAIAFGVQTGRITRERSSDAPRAPGRWDKLRERRMTPRLAALAGPATHIPGLFYLVALNIIVAAEPKVATGLVEVLIFNVIWFAIPITTLVICIVDPPAARSAVGAIDGWAKRNARVILLTIAYGVGAALLVRGILAF